MIKSFSKPIRDAALTAFLLGFLSICAAYADDHYAISLSPTDIQAAVNAAAPGDSVILPAGNFVGFNATVTIPNGISVRGQGRISTIIRKTSTGNIRMFRFNTQHQNSSFNVEISGFTLYGVGDESTIDAGIQINSIRNFQVHDMDFHGFGYCGVEFHGYSYGVVWDCQFIDCFRQGYGYGVGVWSDSPGDTLYGDASWSRPVVWGGNEFVFVEDCYFTGARHSIAAGYGARYVFRHNITENEQGQSGSAHVDAHGRPQGVNFRSTRAVEVYNNIIRNQPGNVFDGINIHGGDALIFDNLFGPNIAYTITLAESGCTHDPSDYPYSDQMRETYVWGNTEDGLPINRVGNGDGPDVVTYCPEWLQENRDFFLYPRPGYTPFPYPHPLRQNTPRISLSSTSLTFTATAGGNQPANQSFQISNSGGGTLTWTVTDNAGWLACSPTSGTNSATVTVSANQGGLSPGTYNARITISSANADNSPQNLSVGLTVTASLPPLSASMTASPISGSAPLTVNFGGSASGGTPPYSYQWNFGDGQASALQSPTHVYAAPGTYAAVLTVTDSLGQSDSRTRSIQVAAATAPIVVSLSAAPNSGLAPLTVNFTGGASGGVPPYSYQWHFGDGAHSTIQNTSHTYVSSGNFTAVLTVTDSQPSTTTSSVVITVSSVGSYSLSLATETGFPAPGVGGTTEPNPGNYTFPTGSLISLRSIPNINYRFSRWTGDILETSMFNIQTEVTIDQNKTITSTFCTKCGDVNGDLQISPADAQAAFDIFLNKINSPSWCERENADVNTSGTKLEPKVTPADAQMIFHKFLKKGVTSDCSGDSRSETMSLDSLGTSPLRLTIGSVRGQRGADIFVPIIVDSNTAISAFGLDLAFPAQSLTFLGIEQTEITQGYQDVAANVLFPAADFSRPSEQEAAQGIVRVGGYRTESRPGPTSGVLVVLAFRVTGEIEAGSPLSVVATYDDLQDSVLTNEAIQFQSEKQFARERRIPEKRSSGKEYHSR